MFPLTSTPPTHFEQLGFLLTNITVQGVSLFMPTLLAGMGYSKIQSQLRTVPPYIVASVWSVGLAYACQRSSRRGLWCLISAPIAILGSCMLVGSPDRHVEYAGIFFLTMGGMFYPLPFQKNFADRSWPL
jgi:hypothetical protein